MSGGHAHGLYFHARSCIHTLPAQCKVAAAIAFVVAVVATPREAFWAFAFCALLLVVVAHLARVPLPFVARRLVFELPLLVFAALLPLLGTGERVDVLNVPLSVEGLWAAWNIAVKATLGALATLLLATTTPVVDILHGLERLRMPRVFVAIAHFMVRYGDLITGEMRRMKIARDSRAYAPRWLWQARALAASLGALFIRSYERGERVYLAMLSRGYTGAVPVLDAGSPSAGQWSAALAFPAAAWCAAAVAWVVAT